MGNRGNFIVSVFIILLVISIVPVSAYNIKIYGSNNFENYIKSGEDFFAEINESQGQVYVNDTVGNLLPCSCSNNYEECNCLFGSIEEGGQKTINFDINQSGSFNSYSENFYVDSKAPNVVIDSFEVEGYTLIISYTVTDDLFEGSSNECSGIEKVEIFVNNYLKLTEYINLEPNSCTYAGSAVIVIEPTPNIFASIIAYDNAGNSNEINSDDVEIDTDFPIIYEDFDIYQNNIVLDMVALNSPQSSSVNLHVFVSDSNLTSVIGDLIDLNNLASQNIGYENFPAICTKIETTDVYECIFYNVLLHVNDPTINITITAFDLQGNSITKSLGKEYIVSHAQNEVIHIGPNPDESCDDEGKCYVNENPILEVHIADSAETTFYQKNIPIKIVKLTEGLTNPIDILNPYSCSNDNPDMVWICKYMGEVNSDLNGLTKNIYLYYGGSDDYGNSLNGIESAPVIIDTVPPELVPDSQEMLINDEYLLDYCVVSNDVLTINVKATDEISPKLKITAKTQNITLEDEFTGQCNDLGVHHLCTINIDNFLSLQKNNAEVEVTVFDLAGNSQTFTMNFDMCIGNLDTSPILVRNIRLDQHEFTIDRRIASYRYWKLYVPMSFDLVSGVVLSNYEIQSCEAYDSVAGMDYVYDADSYYFINDNMAAENAVATIKIGGKSIYANETELTCNLKFSGRIGDTHFIKKQFMNLSLTLNFEGYNIDGPDVEIQKTINKVTEQIKKEQENINSRESVNSLMAMICGYGQMSNIYTSVLQAIDIAIKALATIIPLLEGASKAVHKVAQFFMNLSSKFAWPPGNMYSNLIMFDPKKGIANTVGTGIKLTCFIYNCKFYDAQEAFQFAGTYDWNGDEEGGSLLNSLRDKFDAAEFYLETEGIPFFPGINDMYDELDVTDATANYISQKNAITKRENELFDFYYFENTLEDVGNMEGISGFITSGESHTFFGMTITDDNGNPIPNSYVYYPEEFQADREERLLTGQQVMNFDSWLLNPYRSKHYDALCAPAVLFNMKKEREIKCQYIKCLEAVKSAGIGRELCDKTYKFRECLYLDSAQVKKSAFGKHGLGTKILQSLGAAILGTGASIAFQAACDKYYDVHEDPQKNFGPYPSDLRNYGCALGFIVLGTMDVISFINSDYGSAAAKQYEMDLGNSCEGIVDDEIL